MEKVEPLSPPLTNALHRPEDGLHSGFEQLIQHNAATAPYPPQLDHQQSVDIGSHLGSTPQSRYSSPAPQANMMTTYEHHAPSPYHPASSTYAGGYQTAYPLDPSPYPQLPDSRTTSHNAYSTPATSPPTPVQAEALTTRSRRSIIRPGGATTLARPARIEKPPSKARSKKRKRNSGEDGFAESGSTLLAAPLSVLVNTLTSVTDTDIEAYVKRLPEERRHEVANSKTGKVKRPMNAFMLYRKAYQNRTKEWKRLDDIRRKEESAAAAAAGGPEGNSKPEKGHDNHQVISQVCGASWNMEPQELRDQYDEWAKIERNNHKLAFPDYKFAPAKSKVKKAMHGGPGGMGSMGSDHHHGDRDSGDDNASNLDAYEYQEWGRGSSGPPSRNATRSARFVDPEAEYGMLPPSYSRSAYASPSPGIQNARLPGGYGMPQGHHSSFQYSNPGKPRPQDYGSSLAHGQYYAANTEFAQQNYLPPHYGGGGGGGHGGSYGMHHPYHQGSMSGHIENVYMNKTNSPVSSFHNSPVLDQPTYNEMMATANPYAPHISHSHSAMPHPQQQQHHHHHPQHRLTHHPSDHHNVDPSLALISTRQGAGAGGGGTYDGLNILNLGHNGEFAPEGLPTYHLEHSSAGAGTGGFPAGSPHPQQFEQAYHSPQETGATPGADVGNDLVPHSAAEPSWQDIPSAVTESKIDTTDWETALGGAAEFQLDEIDQILGTTTDSPGG
ncbi:hypothetical protein F4808DRAFT_308492 [Astrocystis sublimbata]|nr:hypothetical protein F4808DRAFT_308492 [Astrocystis sublimbata]